MIYICFFICRKGIEPLRHQGTKVFYVGPESNTSSCLCAFVASKLGALVPWWHELFKESLIHRIDLVILNSQGEEALHIPFGTLPGVFTGLNISEFINGGNYKYI